MFAMNIIDHLKGVQKQANGWIAKCPAHDDGHASLSVSHRDGKWLLHCYAGCSFEAIVAALGIKLSDLFDPETRKSKPNGKAKFIAEYIYRTADGELSRKVCRTADKQFPQFKWIGSDWQAGTKGVPVLPYLLPELTKAAPETPIYICEGEKDCDRLVKLGFTATTNPMGAGKWRADLNEYFRDRLVYILPDNDEPGRAHAQHVARNLDKIAASIRVVPLPGLEPKGDVSDWLETDPAGARLVRECKAAPLWEPTAAGATADDGSHDRVIAELAALSEFAYQKCRRDKAKGLGISLSALDKMVKHHRAAAADEESALPHWKVEPWAGDVPGAGLLDDLKATFEKYIVLPAGAADAAALWVLHSWTMDAGEVSPFLVLVSPTKRCGKTSMLILLLYLTPRSELASNISPSALFRYIEDIRPTLLIDEADSFVSDNEEMRGILDSGHTKAAAHVIRNVEINGKHKPRRFSTWAPKAIATIRALADTLEDRAIVLQLQRKPKTAKVARLRKRDCAEFAVLRRKAARWAEVNFNALEADPDPITPGELDDRAADNWRPLLQIAELAGGEWPHRARQAACRLSGEGHEATSVNVELLADIRLAFGEETKEMRSVDLVTALIADPERPWAEWKRGKPLSQKQLGGLLDPFCIESETVHIEGLKDAKGYKRVRFEEAWEAYLPSKKSGQNDFSPQSQHSEASKRPNASAAGTSGTFSIRPESSLDGSENDDLSYCHAGLDAWTLRKAESDAKENLTTNLTTDGPGVPEEFPPVCEHCGMPERPGKAVKPYQVGDETYLLHPGCKAGWLDAPHPDDWTFNLET
jgi:hypothetical protein